MSLPNGDMVFQALDVEEPAQKKVKVDSKSSVAMVSTSSRETRNLRPREGYKKEGKRYDCTNLFLFFVSYLFLFIIVLLFIRIHLLLFIFLLVVFCISYFCFAFCFLFIIFLNVWCTL